MEINKATAENIDLSLTFVKAKDDCDDPGNEIHTHNVNFPAMQAVYHRLAFCGSRENCNIPPRYLGSLHLRCNISGIAIRASCNGNSGDSKSTAAHPGGGK
jgi:hypothetical protein